MRSPNKYKTRHQNRRECERRLRQVHDRQLTGKSGRRNRGEFVTEAARYAAYGFIAP